MSQTPTQILQAEIDRLSAQLRDLQGEAAVPDAGALTQGQQQYQQLLDVIDEGFCIIEMKFDDQGRACDYLFIETNRAFETHTGLVDAKGRWIREMVPEHDQHWFDIYGEVAKSGKSIRFENRANAMDRWFDVHAIALNDGTGRVAVLFNDNSAQHLAEQALRESEAWWRESSKNSTTVSFLPS